VCASDASKNRRWLIASKLVQSPSMKLSVLLSRPPALWSTHMSAESSTAI
jgi:hypothetical protein